MVKILPPKEVNSFTIYGQHGRAWEYGDGWYSGKLYGDKDPLAGIYQRRRKHIGSSYYRRKHFYPANPQTEIQQANRAKLRNAVLAWQDLTNEQKSVYNELAQGKYISGYSMYIHEYMLS